MVTQCLLSVACRILKHSNSSFIILHLPPLVLTSLKVVLVLLLSVGEEMADHVSGGGMVVDIGRMNCLYAHVHVPVLVRQAGEVGVVGCWVWRGLTVGVPSGGWIEEEQYMYMQM